MSGQATIQSQADAHVRQTAPNSNYAQTPRLLIRGSGSSLQEFAYLHFSRPFPLGATILSATLRLYRSGAWTGANTVNATRIVQAWSESTITYNQKPSNSATHQASISAGAGVDGTELDLDVTAIMADVAAGSAYFGIRVDLTQNTEAALRSSESSDPQLRPQLVIAWSEPPDAPDRLAPDNSLAVNETKPLLYWQAAEQSAYQVQIGTDPTFATTSLDTGKVVATQRSLDLSTTSFPAMAIGASRYWRVKVWSDADLASAWSQTAQLVRTPLSTLTLTAPAATVPETTPVVSWTFAGTQTRYRVIVSSQPASGPPSELWRVDSAGTATSVSVPAGLLTTGRSYTVSVEVWDNVNRAWDQHALASQVFAYVRDGTPAATTGLSATELVAANGTNSPGVLLQWQRSSAPDYWALVVDGLIVADRISVAPTLVSGTSYELVWWGLTPREAHTIEVEAVVQSGGAGTPYRHSGPNAQATLTPEPVGIWLVDTATGDAVQILGADAASFPIGEAATTYTPLGAQSPVRITDQISGYEGTISGSLHTDADRDLMLSLKQRQKALQLILQHHSIPVWVEALNVDPTPLPGDPMYLAGFSFFQTGPPWPGA